MEKAKEDFLANAENTKGTEVEPEDTVKNAAEFEQDNYNECEHSKPDNDEAVRVLKLTTVLG